MTAAPKHIALVCQPNHNSGLSHYIRRGFEEAGSRVSVVDARARRRDRILPALAAFHPRKDVWLRQRWEKGLYAVSAWHRNSRINGRLIDALEPPADGILQIGALYAPQPEMTARRYFIFLTYPLRCALRDKITPWLPPEKDREEIIRLETRLFQNAAHVFVNASFTRGTLLADYGIPPAHVSVAGMGVDDFFLQNPPPEISPALKNNLLFVGWDFGMKGGDVLLKAFANVRQNRPKLTLTIVGPPQGEPQPGVLWAGAIRNRRKLLQFFRDADLFVMPSWRDSFGFVFLEAMSQGLPCIGTAVNAMPEIISDCGFTVPPGDASALAEKILLFYSAQKMRHEMGVRAVARVRESYTWPGVVGRMLDVMMKAK